MAMCWKAREEISNVAFARNNAFCLLPKEVPAILEHHLLIK